MPDGSWRMRGGGQIADGNARSSHSRGGEAAQIAQTMSHRRWFLRLKDRGGLVQGVPLALQPRIAVPPEAERMAAAGARAEIADTPVPAAAMRQSESRPPPGGIVNLNHHQVGFPEEPADHALVAVEVDASGCQRPGPGALGRIVEQSAQRLAGRDALMAAGTPAAAHGSSDLRSQQRGRTLIGMDARDKQQPSHRMRAFITRIALR